MAAKRPVNFSWVIDGLLAGCAYPSHSSHLNYLMKNGIKHLVTLTEWTPPSNLMPQGLKHYHIPVPEFDAPTLQQMIEFISIVNIAKNRNEGLVVHCYWGRGRTGTMLAAYLTATQGLTAEEAIERVRCLRPYSVETYEQEEAVQQVHEHIKDSARNDK